MKNHKTDADFLDKLYAQAAKETPPEALDQAILKHAHAKVPKPDRVSFFQWQRLLSVAAVMVLSVYIFFDAGKYSMDAEMLSPTEQRFRSAAPAFDEEQASGIEEQRLKAEKSKAKKVMVPMANEVSATMESSSAPPELSDSIGELTIMSKSEEEEKSVARKNDLVRSLSKQQVSVELASPVPARKDGENSTLDAEKMLSEIKRLIASGKLADAKKIYQKLTDLYPEYPISSEIVTAFK